jgi:glyoxylase-like metal-dependent hydrolase (beta-lactamase superfamily II)
MVGCVEIACVVEPNFGENAYLIWCREGGSCWVVDPGLPPSAAQLLRHIKKNGLQLDGVLLTHGHLDHIAGVPELLKEFSEAAVYIAQEEKEALVDPAENLSDGFGVPVIVGEVETRDLAADAKIELDGTQWQVLDTSGHSPGGRSLYCPAAGAVFVGDALFAGSVGRTDFHHSDGDRLIRNIRERLYTLPEETEVYSGHGPLTTIGDEKRHNSFVRG